MSAENKRYSFLILLLFGFYFHSYCQKALTTEQKIEDLKFYRDNLSSKHKNPFTRISKEEFNKRVDSVIMEMAGIDQDRFIVELLKLNALIEDEHTKLLPSFEYQLPLKFSVFDEGIAIVASDSLNQKYQLHRIIAVNKIPISDINSSYKKLVKQDNASYFNFFEAHFFRYPELLKGLGLINDPSQLEFQLISPLGDTVSTTISSYKENNDIVWHEADPFGRLLAYSQDHSYWFELDKRDNSVYFDFSKCRETEDDEPFKTFNDRLFKTIKETKVDKIVLDLRANKGGNSAILQPFIESIKKNRLNKKGHFYVLIGPNVMSSSLMNAIDLKRETKAILVGEQTGGNINHFGEIKSFELPHSKIGVTYSTKYRENWKGHNGGLKPDIEITNSLSDFVKSYDRALQTALEMDVK